MAISCHFRDCKALLVTSSRVSSAVAGIRTLPLPFYLLVKPLGIDGACSSNGVEAHFRVGIHLSGFGFWWTSVFKVASYASGRFGLIEL